MKPTILFLLLALICYGACKKDTSSTPFTGLTFTIARSGGLVGITDHYKLSNGKLYNADTTQALPAAKYALVSKLAAAVPKFLFDHPDSSWGCANCADGQALYIGWQKGSVNYKWTIDETTPYLLLPEIASYAAQANAVLDSLK